MEMSDNTSDHLAVRLQVLFGVKQIGAANHNTLESFNTVACPRVDWSHDSSRSMCLNNVKLAIKDVKVWKVEDITCREEAGAAVKELPEKLQPVDALNL